VPDVGGDPRKVRAAGYSQIQEVPAGKDQELQGRQEGSARSLMVDSTGHIAEVARYLDGQT